MIWLHFISTASVPSLTPLLRSVGAHPSPLPALDAICPAMPRLKTRLSASIAWFRHVRLLGWDFIGRIRGNLQFRLACLPERWLKLKMLRTGSKAKYLGAGTLVRAEYGRCEGHFYFHKRASKKRKNQRARCRISRYSQEKAGREAANAQWSQARYIRPGSMRPRASEVREVSLSVR